MWCNGSTIDFGSISLGSNPGKTTKKSISMLVNIKDFLTKMITPGSGISSKRIIGAVCYMIITITIVVISFINPEFTGLSDIITTLIITTASFLGGEPIKP